MFKRILSMLCALVLLWAAIPSMAEGWSYDKHDEMGGSDPSKGDGGSLYVYTANGKTLSLRETSSTSAKILRYIPWGAKVNVIGINGNWAHITYNGTEGYVVRKYLVSSRPSKDEKPSSKNTSSTPTEKPSDKTSDKTSKDKDTTALTVKAAKPEDLTELDIAADASVEPTPPAIDALVYQKPDQKSKVLDRHESGYQVFIRAMNEEWARIYDPETQKEGYMLLEELVMDYVEEEEIKGEILDEEIDEDMTESIDEDAI